MDAIQVGGEKGIKADEKLKRRLYGLFFTIHHQTGQRNKKYWD